MFRRCAPKVTFPAAAAALVIMLGSVLGIGTAPALAQEARLGDTVKVSAPNTGTKRFPGVAFDSANNAYLVAWGVINIGARYVSTDGVPLGTPAAVNSNGAATQAGATGVGCAPEINACLIAWIEEAPVHRIAGRLVRYSGGEVQFLTDAFAVHVGPKHLESQPGVAYSSASNEFLVTFAGAPTIWPDIRAQRVSATGTPIGGEIAVSVSDAWEGLPAVVYNSAQNEFFVVFYHEAVSGVATVKAQRIAAGTGALVGGQSTLIDGGLDRYPDVAYNSLTNQYLTIAWGFSGRNWMLRGRLADANGQALGPSVLSLAAFGGGDGVGLGFNRLSNKFFAAYLKNDAAAPSDEIWGVSVTPDGTPGTPLRVTYSDRAFAVQPAVAGSATDQRWLTVATDFGWLMGQLIGAGSVVPPPVCTVDGTPTVPATGETGASVAFAATATMTNCGVATPTFVWNFGDGSAPIAAQNTTHAYASSGTYTWTLTVQVGTSTDTTTGTIQVLTPGECVPTSHVVVAQPPTSLAAMWQNTGVTLAAGELVTVSVGGSQTWVNSGQAWTANGNTADPVPGGNCPMPGAPRMALVGRIGPSGAPFLLGVSKQFTAPAAGQLYLAPNDDWYMLWDNSGSLTVSVCKGGAACTVNATATVPTTATAGSPVAFAATCSPTGCGTATPTYLWNFGDGTATSTAQNPSHTYASPGTYNWTMTAQVGTVTSTKTGSITVQASSGCVPTSFAVVAQPPTSLAAMWQATGVNVTQGQLVTVSVAAGQTWVNGGQAWTSYGNTADPVPGVNAPMPGAPRMALVGRIGTSGAPFLIGSFVQFTAVGTGQLYLAPNDDWYMLWDNSGSLTVTACSGGTACAINATATVPASADLGAPVAFAATCSLTGCGSATASYSWNFGDGATSTDQNTAHTYAAAGTYTWTLTVQAGTVSTTRTGTVEVTAPSACAPTTHMVTSQPPTSLAAMWQNTGVTVAPGQVVTISVGGSQTWINSGQAWTAAGNVADPVPGVNAPMPGAPRMALVGRIGPSGAPFVVGTSLQLTATTSGQLYLAPNDDWYMLWDNAGTLSVSVCTGASAPCTVNATATVPTTAVPGAPVVFAASCSPVGCGTATPTYLWNFGDGTATSTVQNPSHTYAAAGTYTWTLTVQVGSTTATKTGTINVQAAGCTPTTHTVVAQPPTSLALMWQGTGVNLTAGQAVTLTAGGGQTWINGGQAWTAAGNVADPVPGVNAPMPGAPRMALVGRIGPSGAPFLIGPSLQFTPTASGQLYLAPNDDWYMLWDNSGSLSVTVCK
jgi:PKD repeat protein